jgi:hypothetical protein
MSNQPTPSMSPAGLPGSSGQGNAKYVVVVVMLVAAIGGLLAWRSCGSSQPTAQNIPRFDAAPTPHDDDNVPPPPPPDEPAPSASVARGPTGTFNPCDVKSCGGGKTTDELETALGFRAHQAHRCYDQALAQDGDLKGHVTIAVRVRRTGPFARRTWPPTTWGATP